jgi:type I restriction enzyme S subunit
VSTALLPATSSGAENLAYPRASVRPLSEVAAIQSGLAKGRPGASTALELPYIRTANVQAGRLDLSEVKTLRVTAEQSEKHRLRHEDVLVLEGGDADKVGRGWLWESQVPDCLHQNHVFAVRTDRTQLLPRYLALFINSPRARAYFLACAKQTTNLASINKRQLAALPVPLVPLAQQHAVVDWVEQEIARIDAGAVALERAVALTEPFRIAVVRELLDVSWPERALIDTLHSLRNGVFVSRPNPEPPGVPIYRISAVRPMLLNVADIRYAPADLPKQEQYLVQPEDLLFTRYSGNSEFVGACALVPRGTPPAIHPDKLIRAVVNRNVMEPAFLELVCSYGDTWQQIRSARKTTAGQVGIAGGQLKAVTVPVPPVKVQREVVQHCQRHLEASRTVGMKLSAKRAEVELLRQALLHCAFPAELLSQESARAVRGRE